MTESDKPGPATALLLPFSWLYALGAGLRRALYSPTRAYRPTVRTVSVGNITVGGTGKSPLVELIASELTKRNTKVAVVRRDKAAWPSSRDLSDEEEVFAENIPGVPQFSGSSKAECAKRASESELDILLVDDGFQTVSLARDLDIVTLDALRPFDNGFLLPAGRLREYPRALKRAGAIVLIRADELNDNGRDSLITALKSLTSADIFEAHYTPDSLKNISSNESIDVFSLKGKKIAAFCGIGSPTAFFSTLERLGAKIVETFVFPDHHIYTPDDVSSMSEQRKKLSADMAVTTQKDAVKLKKLSPVRISIL